MNTFVYVLLGAFAGLIVAWFIFGRKKEVAHDEGQGMMLRNDASPAADERAHEAARCKIE